MSPSVIFEEQIEVPLNVGTLDAFRQWAQSPGFPRQGRIDFIRGHIEVDMSPEDLFCHGALKSELHGVLYGRVKTNRLGRLFVDQARISVPAADLSAEPDIVFIAHAAIDDGRVKLVPKANAEPGRFVEIEGPPDLIVEIVSDSSVTKDTRRLPAAYFEAGVREFWLADARGDTLVFHIAHRGPEGFVQVPPDDQGFQHSAVMGCAYHLRRQRDERGLWTYDLDVRA